MLKPSQLILKTTLFLGLIFNGLVAQAITPMTINKETATYIVDVKYPQGFPSEEVNATIKEFIVNTQASFMKDLVQDADTPADAPGKTGLNIAYSVPYETKNALSVQFDISIYHRGAAHPLNTVVVKNFINAKSVNLAHLFVPESNYLKPIAEFSKKEITAKKISDPDWINEGTKPTEENYNKWYFTDKGITVIFNSYQVAAYVYGEQKVAIPLSLISSLIQPEVSQSVWGH